MSAYSTTLTRARRSMRARRVIRSIFAFGLALLASSAGSAYGIVRDNPTYKYQVYGRMSFYF